MNLKYFSWSCLLLGTLSLVGQILRPDEYVDPLTLFTITMTTMSLGFSLVRQELAKLQPGKSDQRPLPRPSHSGGDQQGDSQ